MKHPDPQTTLRLFTAIDVPAPILEAIEPVRQAFGEAGLRPSPPERIHLTLVFLGAVEVSRVPDVVCSLLDASLPASPEIRAQGAGIFGPKDDPRVAWIGVPEVGDRLADMFEVVSTACRSFIKDPEDRAYSPHLTLARARRDRRPDRASISLILEQWKDTSFGQWNPSEIVLYSSEAEAGGHRYRALERLPLG